MSINRLVLRLLRSPLHGLLSRRVCELDLVGRRTGLRRRVPVEYVREGDRLVVLAARASGKRWWRNFAGGDGRVWVTLAGREHDGRAVVVAPGAAGYPEAAAAYARHRRPPRGADHRFVVVDLRAPEVPPGGGRRSRGFGRSGPGAQAAPGRS